MPIKLKKLKTRAEKKRNHVLNDAAPAATTSAVRKGVASKNVKSTSRNASVTGKHTSKIHNGDKSSDLSVLLQNFKRSSKSVKNKKVSSLGRQTAKISQQTSELSVPLFRTISRNLVNLPSKESELLDIMFSDQSIREIIRQHIMAAKEELKKRLDMELPRKIDNVFNVPGQYQSPKKFGLNLQIKDFDASEKFANSLYDVFNKYRSQISIASLGKLF